MSLMMCFKDGQQKSAGGTAFGVQRIQDWEWHMRAPYADGSNGM